VLAGLTNQSNELTEPFRVTLTWEVAISESGGATDRDVGIAANKNWDVGTLRRPRGACEGFKVDELAVVLDM
jgi:hypothetical protein